MLRARFRNSFRVIYKLDPEWNTVAEAVQRRALTTGALSHPVAEPTVDPVAVFGMT